MMQLIVKNDECRDAWNGRGWPVRVTPGELLPQSTPLGSASQCGTEVQIIVVDRLTLHVYAVAKEALT